MWKEKDYPALSNRVDVQESLLERAKSVVQAILKALKEETARRSGSKITQKEFLKENVPDTAVYPDQDDVLLRKAYEVLRKKTYCFRYSY